MSDKIRVYADIREKGSRTALLLEKLVLVIYKRLDIGDYLISDHIVIERKTVNDYMKSLYDGRLFDQARRMAELYQVPIILVEGKYIPYNDRMKFNSSIAKLVLDYGFRVFRTESPEDSSNIIYHMAKRLALDRGGQFFVIHKKPKLSTPREWQLYIVQSFPNIGPKLAERLLLHFGSIEKIVNATISELSQVPGIGERRAKELYKILHTMYRVEKGKRTHLDDFI